jgi:hypothetical protein
MTITLSSVINAQWLTVEANEVSSSGGGVLDSVEVTFGYLFGDTDASGVVNSTDVVITKYWSSSSQATAENFRADIDANGVVNSTDILYAKYLSSTSLR